MGLDEKPRRHRVSEFSMIRSGRKKRCAFTSSSKIMTDRELVELAERKLGKGATVRTTREGWLAERVHDIASSSTCARIAATRTVVAKTRNAFVLFLEQMPDVVG